MSEFERYEYVVTPERNGKTLLLKLLLIAGYALFIIAWIVFGFLTRIFIPLLAFIPLSLWLLIFITWRYVNIEYEYAVESGVVTFSKIYGGRSRKRITEFDIRTAERILPLSDENTSRALEHFAPERRFSFAASEDAEGSMVALCVGEDNTHTSISFTADERLMKLLTLYNRTAMTRR